MQQFELQHPVTHVPLGEGALRIKPCLKSLCCPCSWHQHKTAGEHMLGVCGCTWAATVNNIQTV